MAKVTANQFLKAIFPSILDDEVVALALRGPGAVGAWLPDHPRQRFNNENGCYFCIATLKRRDDGSLHRDKPAAQCIWALVLDDLGSKVSLELAAQFPAPTWRLETSAGNFQWGYSLDPCDDLPYFESCINALAAAGYTDGGARGRVRLMRLPGSRHSTGFEATLAEWEPDRSWDLTALMGQFDVTPGAVVADVPATDVSVAEADDKTLALLRSAGVVRGSPGPDGWLSIDCPNGAMHSDGSPGARYQLGGHLMCFHESCEKYDWGSWLNELRRAALLSVPVPTQMTAREAADRLPQVKAAGLPRLKVTREGHLAARQLPVITNYEYVITTAGFRVRHNMMTAAFELTSNDEAVDAMSDDMKYETLHELCHRVGMTAGADMYRSIAALAQMDPYHPAAEWVESAPWDGTSRFAALIDTIEPGGHSDMWPIYLRRWLIGGIQLWFGWRAPQQVEGVLVLAGPQGIGKTRWLESLLPDGMVATGVALPLGKSMGGDRDATVKATGHALCEIGELDATFRAADVSRLKAFLSETVDRYRKAYARDEIAVPRSTLFAGTVNTLTFLHDRTGNRRYWPVEVRAIRNAGDELDMQQVFAEAKVLWRAGERHWLEGDEKAAHQVAVEEFREQSAVEDRLLGLIDAGVADPAAKLYAVNLQILSELCGGTQQNHPVTYSILRDSMTRTHGRHREIRGFQRSWPVRIPSGAISLIGQNMKKREIPLKVVKKGDDR